MRYKEKYSELSNREINHCVRYRTDPMNNKSSRIAVKNDSYATATWSD